LLCATARELNGPLESWLVKGADSRQAWRVIEAGEGPDAEGPGQDRFDSLTPEQRRLVQSASVLALPFEARAVEALSPSAGRAGTPDASAPSETFDSLVGAGVLRRFGASRFAFASPALRESAYRSLDAASLKRLHAAALAVEGEDSYAALRHAERAGLPEKSRRHSIKATERAWAVSDYGSAITTAQRYVGAVNGGGDGAVNSDLLLALLYYEAGQHADTERHLAEALKTGSESAHRSVLERLLGYNAIFGLGDFDRGREIMESVLRDFEARGLRQDAGYVRNTIAYTLFCTRRFDDAVEMERTALRLLESSDQPGGFLYSVLQLNLGRVYRTLGFHEQALRLFKNGLDAPNLEQSPYMLLIFHTTLAQFYATRGEYAEAVAAFHHCLDLARDIELENASDPVLNSLSRHVGKPLSDRTTRGDEVFFYLYLNLALAYRRMGLSSRSEAYLAGMRGCWGFLGEDVWRAAEAVLEGAAPPAQESGRDVAAEFAEEAAEAERRFEGLTFEAAGADSLARSVAEALADGKVVALAGPRSAGPDDRGLGSLVLYDAREPELAARVNTEVGAYGSPRARTAVLLPEAVRHFDGVAPLPLVLQEATLKPSSRDGLRALAPYGSRVQVLSPEFDGLLFEILSEFAKRTGTGVLAALPFHLRGRDLAVTPAKALSAYLVSSIDHLVLGGRLLAKRWGATAEQNILPFRPRLSRNASIFRRSGGEEEDSFLLLVRTWSFHNYLRLRREMRPVLDLCDGQRTVAEVVSRLANGSPPDERLRQQVCAFLRKLARQSAVVYDDPLVGEREAATSRV
jgi:tetratricopeptide (TPR) repeat protein